MRYASMLCSLAAIALLSGCVPPRKPIVMDPDLPGGRIQRIAVFPAIDERTDRTKPVALDAISRVAVAALSRKHYDAYLANFPPETDMQRVSGMDDEDLRTLVPMGVDAAAFVFIRDRQSGYYVVEYSESTAMAAKLVAAEKGLVWMDGRPCGGSEGVGTAGIGIVPGVLLAGVAKALSDADRSYQACTPLQFDTLPAR